MTNKLVVIINSLKVPKIKKILLYEMKFLVPNYSCLQSPWLGGYRLQIPVLSVLCPQLDLLNNPPLPKKIPGYATVYHGSRCCICRGPRAIPPMFHFIIRSPYSLNVVSLVRLTAEGQVTCDARARVRAAYWPRVIPVWSCNSNHLTVMYGVWGIFIAVRRRHEHMKRQSENEQL